jgi:hypothetical protein
MTLLTLHFLVSSPEVTLDCDADVLFIIDHTASMASKYDATLDIIQDIISRSNISDATLQFGIMIYGDPDVEVIRSFTTISR